MTRVAMLLQRVLALSLFAVLYAYPCPCPLKVARCSVFGDPHYTTFDRTTYYNYYGLCRYVIAKPCKLGPNDIPWSIEAQNFACAPGVSCTESIFVKIYGKEFILRNSNVLEVNPPPPASPVPLPYTFYYSATQYVTVSYVGGFVSLTTDFGLTVQWTHLSTFNFEVLVPKAAYFRNTCGLCGFLSDNPADDYRLPSGALTTSVAAFGNSWNVDPKCTSVGRRKRQEDPCTPDMRNKAREICSVLMKDNFAPCHKAVDPNGIMESCIIDVCAMNGKEEALCGVLSEYAHQCRLKGIVIKWRIDKFCPLKCPDGMVYSLNGPAKTPTCDDVDSPCGDAVGIEGCFCPAGQVLYNSKCIDPLKCPNSTLAKPQ